MRRSLLLAVTLLLLLTGCSQKVKVHALQPAQIDRAAKIKTIAVNPFRYDSVELASKIESELASKRIDGQPYFTMVSRGDIDRIMKEQRLQNSGLLDESTSVEVGNLVGAQALISGVVSSADVHDSYYRERRLKCLDKKCTEVREYHVRCTERTATVAAQLKMVDMEKGDIIYGDNIRESRQWNRCSDESYAMPSASEALEAITSLIASSFAYQLTPHYVSFSVVLLEDPDLDYTDEQEELLENALIYIERQRYDKAEQLLSRLLESTHDRSYVAAYNLGVVKETMGELDEAKQLYQLSDSLTIEPVDAIDSAMLRINKTIADSRLAQEQIAR